MHRSKQESSERKRGRKKQIGKDMPGKQQQGRREEGDTDERTRMQDKKNHLQLAERTEEGRKPRHKAKSQESTWLAKRSIVLSHRHCGLTQFFFKLCGFAFKNIVPSRRIAPST